MAKHSAHYDCSAAGSVPQTSHWQVTTEPAFVTRHKPPPAQLSSSSDVGWSSANQHHHHPHKPQWTDSQRPNFKPTETQEVNYAP